MKFSQPKHTIFFIAFVTLSVSLFMQVPLVSATNAASLSFSPASMEVQAGKDLIIKVHLNTGGELVNAVQADVSYPLSIFDPSQSKVKCSDTFSIEAQHIVNGKYNVDGSNKGMVKVACGVSIASNSGVTPFSGATDVATITLHVRRTAPSLSSPKMLEFVVDNDSTDGKNNYSAVARASDSSNILGSIVPASITINSKSNSLSKFDINNDKTIDSQDLSMLVSSYGLKVSEVPNTKVDINNNNVVDVKDLSILLSNQL